MGYIIVAGASGGIGRALVTQLVHTAEARVIGLCRDPGAQAAWANPLGDRLMLLPWDALDDASVLASALTESLPADAAIHGVLFAAGILHGEGLSPEKRLEEIDAASLSRAFAVNAAAFPVLMQALLPWMKHRGLKRVMAVSAKVGSIEDNGFGGWYAYRASKAALNMLVKNLAIELPRRVKPVTCVAIHPGTTRTRLSEPFQQSLAQLTVHDPEQTAENLLRVFNRLEVDDNGRFLSWDGSALPW